ncbi:MAG: hypothetical protein LBS04_02645 [Tannerellaceae bacterium]|jgi:hypothetical protein|nr:hypothetical protein [Tannerellaceae bacterium]
MKRVFVILMAFCLSAGLSAQKREGKVVKVQGHVHELLTKYAAAKGGTAPQTLRAGTGTVTNINPIDVACWVGCLESQYPVTAIDTAYLLVKWMEDPTDPDSDSRILLWGYQWVAQYTHPDYGPTDVKKYAIDMVRAVANYDCRFSALLQNAGGGGFTAGGFGYNSNATTRVIPGFDLQGAQTDASIRFHYVAPPNCIHPANQYAAPATPDATTLVQQAIAAAGSTGVIKHPLDAAYSYPAYDYDYWTVASWDTNYLWQAGWYRNFWAFFSKAGLTGDFDYAPAGGIADQQVGAVQKAIYFIYAYADPTFSTPVYWDGDYEQVIPCECAPCTDCGTGK